VIIVKKFDFPTISYDRNLGTSLASATKFKTQRQSSVKSPNLTFFYVKQAFGWFWKPEVLLPDPYGFKSANKPT
jgi:hypothetical protein